ncbi:MAG: heme exporter protein CcmB [Candidatus Latescibacteria bacterium]|nr:heme exporter protein CcmB [Candidatus Latescibacterota bacterium]
MNHFKQAGILLWKDILLEFRTKERLSSMVVFSLLVIVVFNFAFGGGTEAIRRVASGVLWVAFIFAGTLGLNRSFALEKDRECLQGLLLCPVDLGTIYAGKMVGNLIFTTLVEWITLPFFALFLNVPILPRLPALLFVMLLGTIGFSSVGTIFAAMSVNTRMREVLLPILLFPIISPVIIAAVEATKVTLGEWDGDVFGEWTRMLGVFVVVFVTASYLAFDYVIEE